MDMGFFLKKLEAECGPALKAAGFAKGCESGGGAAGFEYRFDEPMSGHTAFRVGGPADLWIRPGEKAFPVVAGLVLRLAREEGIPLFILGGGANLVVSDRGIRGIVLDTGAWTGLLEEGDPSSLWIRAGTPVDQAAELAAGRSLSGLEFLAGMPGSVGGAVWMNARCYDRSVSDVLGETEFLVFPASNQGRDSGPARGEIKRVPVKREEFGYKKSPFQAIEALILAACFTLAPGSPEKIREKMEALRRDRKERGQYRFPSAGSAFKNHRTLGAPTGRIVDEMGLLGFAIGGARVAPWHGNFIINQGNATAGDIRALVEELIRRIRAERGFAPEPEILFVGEW
ncbi:MAG: UDP-N-acetylmuramate dehydrogenase [Treponema sp.]|jgi:UDP-N-acetylmuramate dehydrogenase|nr:UDP-N-acetylmuramate dehydrogenase [Treponema sp.]